MEQVISKSALNNILTAAGPAVVDMDEDTKKLLQLYGNCAVMSKEII